LLDNFLCCKLSIFRSVGTLFETTPNLSGETAANCYQSLIGALRWGVELEIAPQRSPRWWLTLDTHDGWHLHAVFGVFACLKQHCKPWIVFDPLTPGIDQSAFTEQDSGQVS
jgi:hypothetical protein